MSTVLRWRPQAREDLLDIYATIALENQAAAERIYDQIEARVDTLAQNPRLGPRRPDLFPTARILIHGAWIILYETTPNADIGRIEWVDVIRVVDGRRDLPNLFSRR